MRLLIDENAPRCLVETLREAGYDITWIRELRRGMSDDEIISLSNEESRAIMTFDKDFGELVYRSGRIVPGIVLVRIADNEVCKRRVLDFLEEYSDAITGYFTVLTERRIRRRRLTEHREI